MKNIAMMIMTKSRTEPKSKCRLRRLAMRLKDQIRAVVPNSMSKTQILAKSRRSTEEASQSYHLHQVLGAKRCSKRKVSRAKSSEASKNSSDSAKTNYKISL